jgi:hypothetical protein
VRNTRSSALTRADVLRGNDDRNEGVGKGLVERGFPA